MPGDTPPAAVRFIHRTQSGWWLWDGTDYVDPNDSAIVAAEDGDPAPGPLDEKVLAGDGIALAVVTDGGVRKLRVTNADPGSEVPEPHVEEFTVYVECPAGEVRHFRLDFSERGTFVDHDFFASCVPDGAGVRVVVLDSNRDGPTGVLDFQIEVASDAPDGAYYYAANVQLDWRLEGLGWVEGADPDATPTVTEETSAWAGDPDSGADAELVTRWWADLGLTDTGFNPATSEEATHQYFPMSRGGSFARLDHRETTLTTTDAHEYEIRLGKRDQDGTETVLLGPGSPTDYTGLDPTYLHVAGSLAGACSWDAGDLLYVEVRRTATVLGGHRINASLFAVFD